jgi:hypothetical protein
MPLRRGLISGEEYDVKSGTGLYLKFERKAFKNVRIEGIRGGDPQRVTLG